MAVNKFIGIGNLGKDPDMRFMPDGKAVCNISIAISEKYRDKDGNQKEVTEWVSVAFFGKLAEIVGEYCAKGSQIYVEGKLKTDKYEKNGETRYATKVVAEKMQLLGGKSESRPTQTQHEKDKANGYVPQKDGALDNLDDDIPF
jgi:single-strand DNA-binding protein